MNQISRGAVLCGALAWLAMAPRAGAAVAPPASAAGVDKAAVPGWFIDQEAGLRTALAPTAAVIERTRGAVIVRYPARLAFAADQAELLPAGSAMLDVLLHSLRDHKRTQLVVAVYTDTIGSVEFNQQQAQARAAAVVAYLQTRGIAADRLIARGVGEGEQLPAPNTPEGRDLNRRLELTITPLSS